MREPDPDCEANALKLVVTRGTGGADFDGWGNNGRRYAIIGSSGGFCAFLIAGSGQPIATVGRSPLHALQRAESVQTDLGPGSISII